MAPQAGSPLPRCVNGADWRAIDFHEGDDINVRALKTLIRAAVQLHQSRTRAMR